MSVKRKYVYTNLDTPRRDLDDFKKKYGGFFGWDELKRNAWLAEGNRARLAYILLFKTGGRVSEVLTLTRKHFQLDFSPNNMMVKGMLVEKQKKQFPVMSADGKPKLKKDGKPLTKTQSVKDYRNFAIRKEEPLSAELIKYLETVKEKDWNVPLIEYSSGKTVSRNQVYYDMAKIGMNIPIGVNKEDWFRYKGDIYPHLLRGMRASCLVQYYKYGVYQMMNWFGWKSSDMPSQYIKMRAEDLAIETPIDWR